jgi:hypothetical protein
MMKRTTILTAILLLASSFIYCQLIPNPEISHDLQKKHWEASWINVPNSTSTGYGVYFYRNSIEFEVVPENFIIHVSADNRYKLFVNGKWIGLGPARSDADNWNFETYDISNYLVKGKNSISAIVWNYGEFKPWAQISLFSGFIVQGDNDEAAILNTPGSWKCKIIEAFKPLDVDREALGTFIIVGPGDQINGALYPWNWHDIEFDDADWKRPESFAPGSPKGVGTDITHALVPRTIPAMELREIPSPIIRKIDGNIIRPEEGKVISGLQVPPNSKTTLLLDQKELVTAYPNISLSGGKGSKVRLSYAEALYDSNGKKQHRDSVENMNFRGNSDLFLNDGETERTYSTLWFRTFRYILIEIETADDALTFNSLTSIFTSYPFQEKAYFKSNDERLEPIWEVGWRTARLCANELYFDCPYYEQMQYVGDTRIQALISL